MKLGFAAKVARTCNLQYNEEADTQMLGAMPKNNQETQKNFPGFSESEEKRRKTHTTEESERFITKHSD